MADARERLLPGPDRHHPPFPLPGESGDSFLSQCVVI